MFESEFSAQETADAGTLWLTEMDLTNKIAKEGLDRCFCGCKYWEFDRCIDCNTHITAVPKENR